MKSNANRRNLNPSRRYLCTFVNADILNVFSPSRTAASAVLAFDAIGRNGVDNVVARRAAERKAGA